MSYPTCLTGSSWVGVEIDSVDVRTLAAAVFLYPNARVFRPDSQNTAFFFALMPLASYLLQTEILN